MTKFSHISQNENIIILDLPNDLSAPQMTTLHDRDQIVIMLKRNKYPFFEIKHRRINFSEGKGRLQQTSVYAVFLRTLELSIIR